MALVLGDPQLRPMWEREVTQMRERIRAMRRALLEVLSARVPGRDFGYLLRQRGMFSYTGLSAAQVDRLREDLRRSAQANVAYALKVAGISKAQRVSLVRESLEEVGLLHLARRPARVLSGGEQQRLALARAWALHPEVLFLDEPTASLDPHATREIETVIRAFDAAGTKVVMATHNLAQAKRLGDEILFIDQGRLVERAPVAEFFSKPQTAQAAAFIKGELPWT